MRFATSTLAMLLALLASCATTPIHDPDVKQSFGRVIEKVATGTKLQSTSSGPSGLGVGLAVVGGAIGAVVGAVIDSVANTNEVKVYDVAVLTEDGRTIVIRNVSVPMHVGNCVKLFEAPRPAYPHIESHTGCR